MKNSSLYLVIPFPLFLSAHFLCALFCLPLFSHHLSSGLFFALPIKNATLFMSPLSFSLPPLLLFPSKRQKRKKGRIRGEWRPCSFSSFNGWGKWAELAPCPYTLPMLQQTPPLALSPLFFSLCPNGKRKRVPLYVHCPSFSFFISQGKEPEKRKIRTRGEMKTAPSSLCLIFAPPSPVLISLPLFFPIALPIILHSF